MTSGPRQPKRGTAYEEDVNEPAKLIEKEAADVEEETPAKGNQPVETVENNSKADTPAFEE